MKCKQLLKVKMLSFFLIFSSLQMWAQNGTITGMVRDAAGNPVANASIVVQPGKKGTITDNDGKFSLSLQPGSYSVSASFSGKSLDLKQAKVNAGETLALDFLLADASDLYTVTVVGSRSLSRTSVETPVPVDVIPVSEVINAIGQVDLNQILNFIAPSFQSARQTIADGTDHVDPAQLRGLGTDQVLVLVNGKRRHQSSLVNVNGTINRGSVGTDMSAIPATAVERIEILRDGAAAQ